MKAKKFDIEQHEKEILEDFEANRFVSVKNAKKKMGLAREAARNFKFITGRLVERVIEN